MKIQSLSIVVPTHKCINSCPFCVSRMGDEDYKNQMDHNLPFYDLYLKDYIKRMEYARDNGCNTIMLTGNGEPQQNRTLLTFFGIFNSMLKSPFKTIEMQTTGTLLDENYLRFLRNHVGVSTISLSISALDDDVNNSIIKPPVPIILYDLCQKIKKYDFTLRFSLNLTSWFNSFSAEKIFAMAKDYEADQIIFRKFYTSGAETPEDKWIESNKCRPDLIEELNNYIEEHGTPERILEYGKTLYDVHGISTVLDDDCMSEELKEEMKYLVLRPNCKLYSKWDTKASLIF